MKLATIMKRVGLGISAFTISAFALVVNGAPASASSIGCNYYKWGDYCVSVRGTGTYVEKLRPHFVSAVKRCNWDMSAEFFDSSGKWYKTYRTGIHYGCWFTNIDDVWVKSNMKKGFVCSTLRTNSSPIASRCESIY